MPISLEPLSGLDTSEEQPLSQQIGLITRENGSFAALSEEALEKAIRDGTDGEKSPARSDQLSEQQSENSRSPSPDSLNRSDLTELRTKLITNVATALNESALSLDFVSLLVSGQRPQVGASSMSTMLKHSVPMGTLGADSISERAIAQPKAESAVCAIGWRLLALESASQVFKDASERLKAETAREAAYWNGIAELVHNGEVVTKSKRGAATLIKYGFSDAGSTYYDKGYGVLARGLKTGAPVFQEQIPMSQDSASVRISLYSGSSEGPDDALELIGQFCPATTKVDGVTDIYDKIQAARNNLFERELMYHLVQEARLLGQHGVRLENEQIVCDSHGFRIQIDTSSESALSSSSSGYDIALAAGVSLRLLLLDVFHRRFERQHTRPVPLQSSPQPLTLHKNKEAKEVPRLLRSVLAHIQQSIAVQRTLRLIELVLPECHPQVTSENSSEAEVFKDPVSVLRATPETRIIVDDLEVVVLSPLEDDKPIYRAKSAHSSTSFFDLTEMESWLKFVSSKSQL